MTIKTSDRQFEIVCASGKILMEKGVKGLTTKALANEMGFTESAIYRHFKSKEDIIVLLLQFLHNNIKERLSKITPSKETAEDDLKKIFKSQFTFFKENPHFIVAILSEGLLDESEAIHQEMLHIIKIKRQVIISTLEKGQKNKEFTKLVSSNDLAHILMGSFRLLILKWKLSHFKMDLIKEGNHLIKQYLNLIKI